MPQVTISPKFQIVIPREIREAMGLRPGEKLQVFQLGQRIALVPVRPIREMRGFSGGSIPALSGIPTDYERRRLERLARVTG